MFHGLELQQFEDVFTALKIVDNNLNPVEDMGLFSEEFSLIKPFLHVAANVIATPMVLAGSIDPHDDASFCRTETPKLRSAAIFVLGVEKLDSCTGIDTCSAPYLYTNKDGFIEMEAQRAYEFDPRKTHAILSSHRVHVVSIFSSATTCLKDL